MDDPQAAPQSWSTSESFYDVLGVESRATAAAIRTAYLHLARSLHPDMGSGNEERFKAVAEAHDVLSHPDKRRRYDEHREWLRRQEQERRRREAAAAAYAAQAAREEQRRRAQAEREAWETQRQAGVDADRRAAEELARRRQAAEEAARRAQYGAPSWQTSFTWTQVDLRNLFSMRGQDLLFPVTGQPGFQRHGFSFASPADGGRIDVDPGLTPGDYVVEGRGYFSPFGGPRGDLILRYSWPAPIRGADVFWQVHRSGRDRWREGSFLSPLYATRLDIPAGAGDATLVYRQQGSPGEFGGPPGDLLVDIVFEGRPRSRLAQAARTVAGAAYRFAIWAVALLAAFLLALMVLGLWWPTRS
jgi:curved DNA-binding protein CbpA